MRLAGGWRPRADRWLLAVVWIALVLLFGLTTESFFSPQTFRMLAGRLPALVVAAVGMTLVVISGGIDLAVGSVAALAAAVMGVAMVNWHWPFAVAAGLALLVAAVAGGSSGGLTTGLRIPPFLTTLGMLEVCRGAAYLVTGSRTMYVGQPLEPLAKPLPVVGVPPTVLVALAVVIVAHVGLVRTVAGRWLVAVGSNEAAARLSGIAVDRLRIGVYTISGGLAGLAGVLATARLGAADPNAGTGLELAAIAAVVIGGTSLAGGSGSILGTVLGVLVIGTLEAGLAQAGASEPVKRIVTGAAIVAAVAADAVRRRATRGRAVA